ncbi:hypothetical protein ABK040_014211 [Willaertia magna]
MSATPLLFIEPIEWFVNFQKDTLPNNDGFKTGTCHLFLNGNSSIVLIPEFHIGNHIITLNYIPSLSKSIYQKEFSIPIVKNKNIYLIINLNCNNNELKINYKIEMDEKLAIKDLKQQLKSFKIKILFLSQIWKNGFIKDLINEETFHFGKDYNDLKINNNFNVSTNFGLNCNIQNTVDGIIDFNNTSSIHKLTYDLFNSEQMEELDFNNCLKNKERIELFNTTYSFTSNVNNPLLKQPTFKIAKQNINLTNEQIKEMKENGFIKIENVIPKYFCDNLVRAINHQTGLSFKEGKKVRNEMKKKQKEEKGENVENKKKQNKKESKKKNKEIPNVKNKEISSGNSSKESNEEEKGNFKNFGNFFPALKRSPLLTDLVNLTEVYSLCESFLGESNIKSIFSGQIALRHPTTQDIPLEFLVNNNNLNQLEEWNGNIYHIDGKNDGYNSIKEGEIDNFDILVGVILKDIPSEYSGNLLAFPKTHLKHAKFFSKGQEALDEFLEGTNMPKAFQFNPKEEPFPKQICGKAGDVVFCHFLLGHSVAPNLNLDTRYQVYFRIQCKDFQKTKTESLSQLWLHWSEEFNQISL